MKVNGLTGKHFGHLTIIKRVPNRTKDNHSMWLCQCDCGKQIEATSTHLTSGHTISCGHVKTDVSHNVRPGYKKIKLMVLQRSYFLIEEKCGLIIELELLASKLKR